MGKKSTDGADKAPVIGRFCRVRDLDKFGKAADRNPEISRVVGLDLANNAGVAWSDLRVDDPNSVIYATQYDLTIGNFDTTTLKALRVQELLSRLQPTLVYLEAPGNTTAAADFGRLGNKMSAIFAKSVTAQQLITSLVVAASLWCEQNRIPCHALTISQLKKYATGVGNAGKELMIKAANEKLGAELPAESYESTGADNIADAIWLCHKGVTDFTGGGLANC